jgi:hypothetical protein
MKVDLTIEELEIVSRALANVHPTKMFPVPSEVIELKTKVENILLTIKAKESKRRAAFSELIKHTES